MKINTEKQEKYKDYILSNYTCDITTGTIFNKKGLQVGCNHDSGYLILRIKNISFRVHRIVWLFAHGSFPDATLDHIDNDRHNNAISNLRLADYSKNAANKLKTKNKKTSIYKGVLYRKDNKKWRYILMHKGIIYRQQFETEIEAAQAYNNKLIELFGEFAHINIIETQE
jgi:hypothetical protein